VRRSCQRARARPSPERRRGIESAHALVTGHQARVESARGGEDQAIRRIAGKRIAIEQRGGELDVGARRDRRDAVLAEGAADPLTDVAIERYSAAPG
jgi:hypothetical protein